MNATPTRRWFRWSLRTLFVAVSVAAVGLWLATGREWVYAATVSASTPGTFPDVVEVELRSEGIEPRFNRALRPLVVVEVRRWDLYRTTEVFRKLRVRHTRWILHIRGEPLPQPTDTTRMTLEQVARRFWWFCAAHKPWCWQSCPAHWHAACSIPSA